MGIEIILVFTIIIGALILFVSGIFPVDLTAILVMTALMVTGVLTPQEAISGFSNSATITILGLLIISEGLKNTGAVEHLGNQVLSISGEKEGLTLLLIMGIAAFSSGFINTTAIVAVFIPVVFKIAQERNINPAILLIPLSFASMVGGSSTMIGTSTNLLINSLAIEQGLAEFNIFKPTLIGLLLLIILMVYMLTIGKKLLRPDRENVEVFDQKVDPKQYLTEITIPEHSPYIGKTIREAGIYQDLDGKILGAGRAGQATEGYDPEWVIQGKDTFIIKTDVKEIVKLNANPNLRILTNELTDNRGVKANERELELFEVLIGSNSNLLDQRIKEIDFGSYYDAWPLAVKKKRIQSPEQLMDHKISYGDILLMSGNSHQDDKKSLDAWIMVQQFSKENIREKLLRQDKKWISVVILLAVVLLAVSKILPILVSAWTGVSMMFITGCITLKKAYDNVEWKVIFLLAGIIPLGTALTKSGADQLLANGLLSLTGEASLHLVVSILFAVTVLFTGIVSNQATAVLLLPIAFKVANDLSLPAEPLVMAILFGASSSFLTPVGYQTNAMVLGPGNYRFVDFLKVGGPLALIF